jgi:hypothetical protein
VIGACQPLRMIVGFAGLKPATFGNQTIPPRAVEANPILSVSNIFNLLNLNYGPTKMIFKISQCLHNRHNCTYCTYCTVCLIILDNVVASALSVNVESEESSD